MLKLLASWTKLEDHNALGTLAHRGVSEPDPWICPGLRDIDEKVGRYVYYSEDQCHPGDRPKVADVNRLA